MNKKIQEIKINNSNKTQIELEEICRKKGGTSLIAAIIIAIVTIVLPTVLTIAITTNNISSIVDKSKTKSLEIASNNIADWYEQQYQLYLISSKLEGVEVDEIFIKTCITNNCISGNGLIASNLSNDALIKINEKSSNIITSNNSSFTITNSINNSLKLSYVAINSNTQRSCVKLSTGTGKDYPSNKTVCSSACSREQCISNVNK